MSNLYFSIKTRGGRDAAFRSLFLACALFSTPFLASAQGGGHFLDSSLFDTERRAAQGATRPGLTIGTPVAYGAAKNQAFVGVGGSPKYASLPTDGSAVVGFGVGDPNEYLAMEVAVSVISLKTKFGDSGAVNFKIHRILPNNFAIALGIEDVIPWGIAKKASIRANSYAVLTNSFSVFDPLDPYMLSFSLGVGNGRFGNDNRNINKIGMFGSASLQVHSKVSLVSSWSGTDLNAGVSIAPFADFPIVMSFGRTNVLVKNKPPRWVGSIGIAIALGKE